MALDNRSNVSDIHDPTHFKFLHQYSHFGIKLRLETYFKFFFVREPFERLLSAYEDKFVKMQWPEEAILTSSKRIIDYFKFVADPKTDDQVTFSKFIFYVSGAGFNQNRHWNTYDSLCHPCDINYDFIGHFDKMPQEAPFILKRTGMDRVATFPDFHTHNTSSMLHEKYSQVPRARIVKLARAFQKDFKMFNFSFPGPLSRLMRGD